MRTGMDWGRDKCLNGAKVLMAVERQLTRELLVTALKSAGAGRILAGMGPDMLRQAADFAPELVLSEFDMEPLNGAGFIRALKGHPTLRQVPAIMVVHSRDYAITNAATAAGAGATIPIPFTVADVLAAVRKVMPPAGR